MTNDTDKLKKHVEKMSINSIKDTCHTLGCRLGFSGRKPNKQDYVDAFMKFWQSIHKKASTRAAEETKVSVPSSSGYAGLQDETKEEDTSDDTSSPKSEHDSVDVSHDQTVPEWTDDDRKKLAVLKALNQGPVNVNSDHLMQLIEKKSKWEASINNIRLNVSFQDDRKKRGKATIEGGVIEIDQNKSMTTLMVEIHEKFLTDHGTDHKKMIFVNGRTLYNPMTSLAFENVLDGADVVCCLLDETSEDWEEHVELCKEVMERPYHVGTVNVKVPTKDGDEEHKMYYNRYTTGHYIFQYFKNKGLTDFALTYGTGEKQSVVQPYDNLLAYFQCQENVVINLQLRNRGGGKGVKKMSKINIRNVCLNEKRSTLQEHAKEHDVKMLDTATETIEIAKQTLSSLYVRAENDSRGVIMSLFQQVPTSVLGTSADNSPLMEAYKTTRGEYRIQELGDMVMRTNFEDLYGIHAEISGLVETCELTWDIIVNGAIMKDGGNLDWSIMKRLIEDAITIRASQENSDL
eukprot:Skav201496  [mRNA]  locus=scaffold1154:37366:38916:- [translate_table: standard]